jgi:hypothetical protein
MKGQLPRFDQIQFSLVCTEVFDGKRRRAVSRVVMEQKKMTE